MKRALLSVTILAGIVTLGVGCSTPQLPTQQLTIGDDTFTVEVADTRAEREQGLAGRGHLDADKGMLFTFEAPGRYTLWMQNTLISLDAVWIADGKVIDLTYAMQPQGATPEANLPLYTSATSATQVVELLAGTIESKGIQVGQEAILAQP
jgi:uncharacterized membrane protein (UPF0127 family)